MNHLLQKLMLSGSTTALLAVTPFAAALAQDNDIEQVVVSASRISLAGYSQPTPVTVIGAAQIEQDAYANIADSIRNLPQVSSAPVPFSASSGAATSGVAGEQLMNLRNLGITRTLVLFDGQRVVSSTLSGGVDISTLPQAVVSRVDVVTGGASAAWGSDAVAGVVNLVIDKNYSGFKASVQGTDTYNGSDRSLTGDATWGSDIAGGRGHLEFAVKANINPDTVLVAQQHWFKGAYWVSNPSYAPGNGQPQLVVGTNVGLANSTEGGIINASPAGTAGPGVAPATANALRGIEFVNNGIAQPVNYGNLTLGSLSNGGSLTRLDTEDYYAPITTPSNIYTFFGFGRYKLTDTIQASLQLNGSYMTGKSTIEPLVQTALTIRSDNAYIPASVRSAMQNGGITSFTLGLINSNNFNNSGATGVGYFDNGESNLGPGASLNHRTLMRGVFSLDGTLGDDWSWNAYIQDSGVRVTSRFVGNAIIPNLTAAQDAVTVTSANVGKTGLALGSIACRSTLTGTPVTLTTGTSSPGCIPLDVFGNGVASASAIGYIMGTAAQLDFANQSTGQIAAEGSVQGTLPWGLPAGKVAVAFGGGYRQETASIVAAALAPSGGYSQGDYNNFPQRSYHVVEGFAEVDAPILKDNIVKTLDFSMAGRMTGYSTSGLVETWKLGATSQVIDDVKLRTTWSVDIRAPQLLDLYSLGVLSSLSQRDPKTQATVIASTFTAGNPNLVPEVARTVSGGVVLTPTFLPGFTMSADWYAINLNGQITSLAAAIILNQCNATLPSQINIGQSGNPNDPLCSRLIFNGPGGSLSQINTGQINIAHETTSGLDLQANYMMDFWEGSLAWSGVANYTDELTSTNPGQGTSDIAGSNTNVSGGGSGGPVIPGPKWRGTLGTTYSAGPYAFTVQTRWYGTSVNSQNGNTGNLATAATANLYDPKYFEVPFVAYLDLRANYKWNDNISFFGGIDNTLNTPPPLIVPNSSTTQVASNVYYNTNPFVYDMLGRNFRIGVRFNY